MFKIKNPLILLAFGVLACEPMGQEQALDKTAIFDQKPVRAEGWKVEGQSSTTFNGMQLSAASTTSSDGLTRQEVNPAITKMAKAFPALESSETGTLRMSLQFPKFSKNGLRFEVSFATGVGLPSDLRISEAGITAKCGSLSVNDSLEIRSEALSFEINREYEFRVVRTAEFLTMLVDNVALIKDLPCLGQQDPNEEARTSGFVEMTLHSPIPTDVTTWTTNELLSNESQVLLNRVTVYKEAKVK